MKNNPAEIRIRILALLSALFLLWALGATLWAWRSRPVAMAPGEETPDKQQILFVDNFIQYYFNYSAESLNIYYNKVGALLSPELQQDLKNEIEAKREVFLKENRWQQAHTRSIWARSPGEFEAHINLEAQRNDQREQHFLKIHLEVGPSVISPENPWGLVVKQINIEPQIAPTAQLQLTPGRLLQLEIPCAYQDSNLREALIVQRDNLSKIEWKVSSPVPAQIQLSCPELTFSLSALENLHEHTLYHALKKEQGSVRKRSKDVYEKTIEKVLGISLE